MTLTLSTLTPADVAQVEASARKAVRLHLAEFGHRDPSQFRADVAQEAFVCLAAVTERVAGRPTLSGPSCQRTMVEGVRGVVCDHPSCSALLSAMPAPAVLARWAARDAVRDVLAHERNSAHSTPETNARLAAERAAMLTPDARQMGTADRKPAHAFTSDLRTAHVDPAAFLRAFDVPTMPTLALLLQTASDSRRGGVAAWSAVGRITGETSGHARQAIKARAEREWAVLADSLDIVRTMSDAGRYEGLAPVPTLQAMSCSPREWSATPTPSATPAPALSVAHTAPAAPAVARQADTMTRVQRVRQARRLAASRARRAR